MAALASGVAKTRDHFFGNISQRDLQAFKRVLSSLQDTVLKNLEG